MWWQKTQIRTVRAVVHFKCPFCYKAGHQMPVEALAGPINAPLTDETPKSLCVSVQIWRKRSDNQEAKGRCNNNRKINLLIGMWTYICLSLYWNLVHISYFQFISKYWCLYRHKVVFLICIMNLRDSKCLLFLRDITLILFKKDSTMIHLFM